MPRMPRITGAELARALRNGGWVLARNGARHDVYTHPDRPGLAVVPRHAGQILPVGTLKGILAGIGMTPDELRGLL